MKYFDSPEAERLKKLIADKETFYHKQVSARNKTAAQFLQKEIMFLRNDILPLVLQNSNIAHWEIAKYIIRAYETALNQKCNALLTYLPINSEYINCPIVGIANTKQNLKFRTPGAVQVYCNELEIINMDGNGAKVEPISLTINDLMQ